MNNKVAIVFWSGTGNTEAMANLVADGVKAAGSEPTIFGTSDFDAAKAADFSAIAFGCPAMGSEVLEEDEFQPMYDAVRDSLNGKAIGLFGSYGWGDGQWMRDWADDIAAAGGKLVGDPVMANGAAEGADADSCTELGKALVNA